MFKKLNQKLEKALVEQQYTAALPLQKETYSLCKSGSNLLIDAPQNSGKTFNLVLHIINKLDTPYLQSPRALIIVPDREQVMALTNLFESVNQYNKLRVFQTYEQTDIDQDKNLISEGIDVLIGTPQKITNLFAGAGFDINQLKVFAIDNLNEIVKKRQENLINRIIDSCPKTQFIITTSVFDAKIERILERNFENITHYTLEEFDE